MIDKRLQVIEKIKKLLRLAKSSNEHEAALAAARAQELLAKYNLDEELLTEKELPREAGVADTATVKKPARWVYLLASSVAGAFDCQYAHSASGHMLFFGVELDHEVAAFTFGYLYRAINRLAAQFMKKSQNRRLTVKGGKKVRLSYCLGASHVVSKKLREQKERTPVTTAALVPVKEALIKAKCDQYGVHTTEQSREDLSTRAYWSGVRDGASIDHGRKAVTQKKEKPLRIGHGS
jgi:hypothetical protein